MIQLQVHLEGNRDAAHYGELVIETNHPNQPEVRVPYGIAGR